MYCDILAKYLIIWYFSPFFEWRRISIVILHFILSVFLSRIWIVWLLPRIPHPAVFQSHSKFGGGSLFRPFPQSPAILFFLIRLLLDWPLTNQTFISPISIFIPSFFPYFRCFLSQISSYRVWKTENTCLSLKEIFWLILS